MHSEERERQFRNYFFGADDVLCRTSTVGKEYQIYVGGVKQRVLNAESYKQAVKTYLDDIGFNWMTVIDGTVNDYDCFAKTLEGREFFKIVPKGSLVATDIKWNRVSQLSKTLPSGGSEALVMSDIEDLPDTVYLLNSGCNDFANSSTLSVEEIEAYLEKKYKHTTEDFKIENLE